MKYNEELFNISSQLYSKTNSINENNDAVEKELLKILLNKIKDNLNTLENQINGILKIKFISRVFGSTDEGYKLIEELIKSNKFNDLAANYCIYIANNANSDDQYFSTYYEIIWDYKTYFETLNMNKNEKNLQKC